MFSKHRMLYFLFVMSILLLCVNGSNAQTTGKIIGKVIDAKTNEPLPGANVIIQGTTMGAATDTKGDFFIINVPPGTYDLRVQMIGYQTYIIQNVQVSVNRSSNVNARLTMTVIEGEEVIVSADKITVKKDQTSSIKNVSGDQISILPVETVDQVIEMQAGVVGGHFRGGRLNEVSYLIDGMQVDEAFRGEGSSISIEKEVVQDLEVITGTFNAEYGKAMSGIVNMVTKDGADKYHGSAFVNFGNYVTGNDDIYIGLDQSDFTRKVDYKVQLEGPVWKKYLTFIGNVRYVKDDGYLNGIRRFNVADYSQLAEAINFVTEETPWDYYDDGERYYSEYTGDGEYVPMLDSETKSYFAKLSFRPVNNFKMSLMYNYNDYNGAGSYNHSYKYNPDGVARSHSESEMYSLHINHLLNSRMFYDLKLSYNDNWNGRYLYEDPLDLRHVPNSYSRSVGGFSSGGTDKTHNEEFSEQYIGKFDLTWQINKHHSIKTGVQYSDYRVENKPILIRDVAYGTPDETNFYYDEELEEVVFKDWDPEILPEEAIEMDQYVKEPYDFSYYIQDKMEYDALVINFGLRYDYFNSNTVYPSNRMNPANQGEYDDPSFMSEYPDADPQVQWSPRLGLSYTLGQAAVLHFSYGHFFQMPPFYSLYTNHRFMIPTKNFTTEHGNPQLKAQKTVKYEMGLWQELMPGLGFEVSVYYSDIYDLLTAVVWTTYNQIQYAVYDNKDYANTKGLELKLDWVSGPIQTNLNYTLQYTRGNADNPTSTYNRLAQNQDPIPKLIPLSWDQRHTLSLNIGYLTDNWTISTTGYLNSGFPYTIQPIAESRLAKQSLLPNNAQRPVTFRLDLQGHYDIPVNDTMKFRLFLYVNNLLDRLNETDVYGSTGRAYTTILGNVAEEAFRSNFNTVLDQFQNPGMYSAPREVKLGVGFLF